MGVESQPSMAAVVVEEKGADGHRGAKVWRFEGRMAFSEGPVLCLMLVRRQ